MELRKIINRKAMLAIDELLIVILVILTIAAVLMMIFKVDILAYIRNLPGYGVPEDEEVDLTNLTKEQYSAICPVQVAKVVFSGNRPFRKEYIYSPDGTERIQYDRDDVYLDGNSIKINDANFLKDTEIGVIDSNDKISIKGDYIFSAELMKLDGAWFITKKRRVICGSKKGEEGQEQREYKGYIDENNEIHYTLNQHTNLIVLGKTIIIKGDNCPGRVATIEDNKITVLKYWLDLNNIKSTYNVYDKYGCFKYRIDTPEQCLSLLQELDGAYTDKDNKIYKIKNEQ